MVRFFLNYAYRLLIAIAWLIKTEETDEGRQLVSEFVNNHRVADETAAYHWRQAALLYVRPGLDDITSQDVLTATNLQLARPKGADIDLIDTIVKLIGLPYGMNRLGVGNLRLLRDAILRPTEMAAFRKATTEAISCKCGHTFINGEMASTIIEEPGDIQLYCHKCVRPSQVACDYCGKAFKLVGKAQATHMKEADCGCRKRAERDALALAAGDILPTNNLGATAGIAMPVSRLEQRRAGRIATNRPRQPAFTITTNPTTGPDWVTAALVNNPSLLAPPLGDDDYDDEGPF